MCIGLNVKVDLILVRFQRKLNFLDTCPNKYSDINFKFNPYPANVENMVSS